MRIVLLFGILIVSSSAKDWWENGNFYQIYPRSFKDSNGDGIGDLNGITSKLEYLKEIGITGTWLSPIFKSPMKDFGYDIADYYQIQPEYGTMEDFDKLIAKARELGIKIILDFVPNHTSNESEWFIKSVKKIAPYTDFYIWHNGTTDEGNPYGKTNPPNNWVSAFRYSAWEWNDERKQYYLHQFAIQQPDLNYRNPVVVDEMKNIIKFWMGKGVSGFRIDAVPFLFEDSRFPDEPINENCPDPDDYCHTQHIYTNDQPETYDMVYQWREVLNKYTLDNGGDTRIMMTEAYTSLPNIIKFYGENGRNGSHIPFNFQLISYMKNNSTSLEFNHAIDSWLNLMPKGVYANWVMGNHDNKRLASRFGKNRADLLNILLQTLPGIAVTYNGEEIAMTDVYIPWSQTVDPQACNTNSQVFNEYSRDPARTPFQWDASPNSGFSTNTTTWLPASRDFATNNVALQENSPISHVWIFKKLTLVRQEESFQTGSYDKLTVGNDIFVYKREAPGSDVYVIVLNFGRTPQTLNLKEYFPNLTNTVEVITTSVQSQYSDGDVVQSGSFIANAEVGTVLVDVKTM